MTEGVWTTVPRHRTGAAALIERREHLAACPNVCCKLSGLAYRADWQRWRRGDFAPYLDLALERFGPGRLMVGSNWPVCTVAGAYNAVLDIVLDRVRTLFQGEQAQILGGTCTDVYRLGSASLDQAAALGGNSQEAGRATC